MAREVGGSRVPFSGSAPHAKGDAVSDRVVVECKTTSKKSYAVSTETWRKVRAEARKTGKEPVMQLELENIGGSAVRVAVIDWNFFLELLDVAS